jgi:hypothetical protein
MCLTQPIEHKKSAHRRRFLGSYAQQTARLVQVVLKLSMKRALWIGVKSPVFVVAKVVNASTDAPAPIVLVHSAKIHHQKWTKPQIGIAIGI